MTSSVLGGHAPAAKGTAEPGVDPGVDPGVEPRVVPGVDPGVEPGVEPGAGDERGTVPVRAGGGTGSELEHPLTVTATATVRRSAAGVRVGRRRSTARV